MGGAILLIVVLILAAMVLFVLEIVTPLFGLLGALALGAMAGAVWQAFGIHPVFGWTLAVILLVLTPVYLVLLVKWLPRTSLGRSVFLRVRGESRSGQGTPEAQKYAALVGRTGMAETILRPSGTVRIDRQRLIALSESGVIQKGRRVKVISAAGTNIIVREVGAPS